MPFEIDFPQMVLDSFFSGILDVNAQYSGFQKQKFPALIPESLLPCMERKKKKSDFCILKMTQAIKVLLYRLTLKL